MRLWWRLRVLFGARNPDSESERFGTGVGAGSAREQSSKRTASHVGKARVGQDTDFLQQVWACLSAGRSHRGGRP